MAALPYMQLYVADYLADTIHLTTEENGAYILIIMNYWQTGKPIPEKRLQPISRVDNGRWTDVKDSLIDFFVVGDDGSWIHARIEEELEKVRAKSIKCSDAGKKSALAKALKNKNKSTDVERTNLRTFNHTETYTETKTLKDLSKFKDFWTNYPRKENKKKAETAFNRLNKTNQDLAIVDCKTRYAGKEKQFIPIPTTYLHGERWNDERDADNGVAEKPWHETAKGISEMGVTHNIFEQDYEHFQTFKHAVYKAAGHEEI